MAHPGGRPRKYKSVEQLQKLIDGYFESCYADVIVKDKDGHAIIDDDGEVLRELQQVEPFTITGLALAMGTSRETLMEIETQRSDYADQTIEAMP